MEGEEKDDSIVRSHAMGRTIPNRVEMQEKERENRETNAVWNHEIEKHGKGSKREGISIQPKIRNE